MLDGLLMLLLLSLVMALASFLAGALPLSMTLSSSQLRLISTIGMGVLVGTSLIVIIPEGVETVYSTRTRGHASARRSLALHGRTPELHTLNARSPANAFDALPGPVIPSSGLESAKQIVDTEPIEEGTVHINIDGSPETTPPSEESDHHEEEESAPTFYIGLSLILGFILMFLVDKLPRHASENLQTAAPTRHISLDNLSQGLHSSSLESDIEESESESFLQSLTPSRKQTRSLATTTGLVIHAAADGIAMGASASSSDTKLGFIIFVALMIHKAPAAFGLTSVLLKQGLSKRAARGHLIIFSLAAPFGAIATWLLVHIVGNGGSVSSEAGQWWTGMLLLFSAGTFLYVAMHAMQEDGSSHDHSPATNGYGDVPSIAQRKKQGPQMRDTLATVAGMLIPLLTQLGDHHH